MECMAGDDESHSEDGDFLAAGGAAGGARTRHRGSGSKAMLARRMAVNSSSKSESLREEALENSYVVVLFESREGCLIAAGDAKQAVGEDPFSVVDVTKTLLDGPFAGSVAEIGLAGRSAAPIIFSYPEAEFRESPENRRPEQASRTFHNGERSRSTADAFVSSLRIPPAKERL